MDRRAEIVGAAAELFAARGFSATAIDDIGAKVGITGPAIYRHFKGKDALLSAVVGDAVSAFAVDESDLRSLVTATVAAALEHPARLATYIRERHRLTGEARDDLVRAERRVNRPWYEAIGASNPDLSQAEVQNRQFGVLSAMSSVAVRPSTVARPELEPLLVSAMLAVLTSPPSPVAPVSRPPGRLAKDWEPTASRRELILAAALRLFRERGYHGVGIDEIGEAAGITGPTVYFHYETKAAILLDAYERAGVRVVAGVHDALAGAHSASDALDRLAASFLDVGYDSTDLIIVTNREGYSLPLTDRPRLSKRLGDVLRTWVAVVRELRPDLDEGATRALVSGVIPLMNVLVQRPGAPANSVPLVRAWCLGTAVNERLTPSPTPK
jgi:AcrR family transcriptional regulator